MGPVRKTTVIDFLEWTRRHKPEVTALCQLGKSEFMGLVVEYERSKGVRTLDQRSNLYLKWESTQWIFASKSNDGEALAAIA